MSDDNERGAPISLADYDGIASLIEGGQPDRAPEPPPTGDPFGDFQGDEDAPPADLRPADWRSIAPAVIVACAREPQNDTGNGARLLHYFADHLLHVREVGWHTWAETHWRREGGSEAIVSYAQRTAARIALEADYIEATPYERAAIEQAEAAVPVLGELRKKKASDASKKEAQRLEALIEVGEQAQAELEKRQTRRRAFAVSSGNASRIRGMIDQALPHRSVSPQALDADPLALNVENGTLVFRAVEEVDLECPDPDVTRTITRWVCELQAHDRGDLITKVAPVVYDAKATAPRFAAFIEMVQPVTPIREFLQTYHGYALTGQIGEQCLVLNYGMGANGKSTFVDILARVMGDYSLTMSFESLTGENSKGGSQASPDLARLPGARLVRASEPERNVHFKESLIKSLTGGEPMLVRHNFRDFFEFRPVFKLSLSANQRPEIGGVDHGIWRRIRLVPWPVTITAPRPFEEVIAEFWDERSGILNWLIEGALRYLNGGLPVPQEISDATAEYREDMDPVGGFITDCVRRVAQVEGAARQTVRAREVYQAFVAWGEANAVRPWKEKSFATAMHQKGYLRERSAQGQRYLDIELHDVPARERRRDDEPPHPADTEVP